MDSSTVLNCWLQALYYFYKMNANKTSGLSILITGGTSGLGFELSKYFIGMGNRVYILGRKAPESFPVNGGPRFIKIDFSDLRSTSEVIRKLAGELNGLDIIVNNAGVMSPPTFTASSDGIEYTYQVNWLSHLVINEILIREGKLSPGAKIVSVTSPVYKYVKPGFRIHGPENYSGFRAYAESKYYMILTGRYLERVFPENDFIFFSFDPGTFSSGIARMQKGWFRKLYRIGAPFLRSPARPASNLVEILRNDEIVNGAVYSSVKRMRREERLLNEDRIEKFIEESKQLSSRFVFADSVETSVNCI